MAMARLSHRSIGDFSNSGFLRVIIDYRTGRYSAGSAVHVCVPPFSSAGHKSNRERAGY
jgi:hypothetical protein